MSGYSNLPTDDEVAEAEKMRALTERDEPQYITPIVAAANDPNFLIFSLDIEPTIEKIENELKGKYFDPEQNLWVTIGQPKFNEKGINALMFIIRNKLHKLAQLTAISDEDCKRITRETTHDVNDSIYINWDRWDFSDKDKQPDISEYSTIVHMIEHNVYFAVMRAKDGGERKTIRQMYNYVQRSVDTIKQKGRGLFSGILPSRK